MGNVEKPGKNRVCLDWTVTWPTLQIFFSGKNWRNHAKGTLVGCRVCHPLSSKPEVSVSYRRLSIHALNHGLQRAAWIGQHQILFADMHLQSRNCLTHDIDVSRAFFEALLVICSTPNRSASSKKSKCGASNSGDGVLWEAFLGGEQRWREAMP